MPSARQYVILAVGFLGADISLGECSSYESTAVKIWPVSQDLTELLFKNGAKK